MEGCGMKKIVFMFIAAVICMSFVSVSFAGNMGDFKGGRMGGKKGMCPMCCMNKSMMMEGKKLVATQDGGAILMMGNKLIKYDSGMNVVKEVEIKMDMEAMKKTMDEMRDNCPMCKGRKCDMKGMKK
jgi:hypothetical protein